MNPIDDVVAHLSKTNTATDENTIYVTDMVKCSHYRVLVLKNPQLRAVTTPGALIGTLIHEGLGKVLGELGYLTEAAVEVEVNGVRVVGRVDAVDDKYIYEFKYSTGTGEPQPQHILQLKIYLYMWLRVNGEKKKGKLIYITPSGVKEHVVDGPVSEDEFEKLVEETVEDRKAPRWRGECFKCPLYYYCDKAKK